MKKYIINIVIFIFCVAQADIFSMDFDLKGKIESVRKNNLISIVFTDKPDKEEYLILEDDSIVGKIKILSIDTYYVDKKIRYRALAEYTLKDNDPDIIKAGSVIALLRQAATETRGNDEVRLAVKKEYENTIRSSVDNREMILIPEGKFVFGSDTGDKDEAPEQIKFLDNYYIDKYEVSNKDFQLFISETNKKPPVSWNNGKYKPGEDDFPVLVSYMEANDYAKWAKKRLPTEQEWEKAARGPGLEIIKRSDETFFNVKEPVAYPWGSKFDAFRANSVEFWEDNSVGSEIKSKYSKGLLPVGSFSDTGASFHGVINMAGNACEWTSSWYAAYQGSQHTDKRYGTQFKVVRGGAWFSSKYKVRATDREVGGIPNLYEDHIAGFRCVKDVE